MDDDGQTSKARWLAPLTTAVAVAGLFAAASGAAMLNQRRDGGAPALSAAGATPMHLEVYQSEYGIGLGMTVTPAEARRYTSSVVQLGDQAPEEAGYFWSERWDEHHPPPDPFPVRADTKLLYEFGQLPDCSFPPPESIVIQLDSLDSTGAAVSDTYVVSNIAEYRRAYQERCDAGVHVSIAGGSFAPNGDSEVAGTVINPGPGPVVVTIPEFNSNGTHWDAVSVTVPAGERAGFTVKGTGAPCERDTPDSWSDGRLLVNGKPYELADTGDHWCG